MPPAALPTGAPLAQIGSEPLSVEQVVAAVSHPYAGAVVTFVGQVRDHDGGRPVRALEYSCHPSAQQVAADLAARHARTDGVVGLAVAHRVGPLRIGDLAIVAAVSAAHRGLAFEVCERLVDDFKAGVPIWKHQVFADGTDEWVGAP